MAKTKHIVIRCEESLYNFIKEFSRIQNKSMSEVVRDIIVWFSMSFLLGEMPPISYLEKKAQARIEAIKKRNEAT